MARVEKSTFQFFTEKFIQNLPDSKDELEAFEKTCDDIGFRPFKNSASYRVLRWRDRNNRRKER